MNNQENITLSRKGENLPAINNGKKSYLNRDLHSTVQHSWRYWKGRWRDH
jgi:hypothetical protein